jgi:hypothetical protein
MSWFWENLEVGNMLGIFDAIRGQELSHGKVGEFHSSFPRKVDNSNQAWAGGQYGVLGIHVAPMRIKSGNPRRIRINFNCENFCELLDTKRASSHRDALKDTMGVLPLLLVDAP